MLTRVSFNPRAPRGARLALAYLVSQEAEVSIHAPRAGRDAPRNRASAGRAGFNPRAPRGARLRQGRCQSSLGCFNPRAPRGARRDFAQPALPIYEFQSTRPARGATQAEARSAPIERVSIHAPRAGRDEKISKRASPTTSFNPRAPRGARQYRERFATLPCEFQSTRPARGATAYCQFRIGHRLVSIHAPRAGRVD